MFERFESAKRERGGWRWLAMVGSLMAHAGLGMGVLVWSFWHIDKLQMKGTQLDFHDVLPPPPALGAPEAPPAPTTHKPPRKPTETVQPTNRPNPEPAPATPDDGNAAQTPGDPNGTPGGDPDAPPSVGPPAVGTPIELPPAPVKVDVSVLEAQRIRGNRQIGLPAAVLANMRDANQTRAQAMVLLCLDAAGAPQKVQIVKSTGFPAADEKIRREMADWRYRPLMVSGRAMPACTAVTFVYVLE